MSTTNKKPDDERVMASNPLEEEDDEILSNSFYRPGPPQGSSQISSPKREKNSSTQKPLHYKTISISLYTEDIEQIDGLVRELKRRGYTKMNRSALIRFALDTVDINALPRQY